MNNDNVVVEKNKDGSFNVKIKEGETIYEIPHVMPAMVQGMESDWLVNVLRPSSELVSSKVVAPVRDENELKVGQIWREESENPFKEEIVHARIEDIKDGYVKYDAYYKCNIENKMIKYGHSCPENMFKNLYPKRVE
jgi:hypothetical protein